MAATFSFSSCLFLLLAVCLGQTYAQEASIHEGCIHMPIVHSTNSRYFGKRAVSLELSNRSDIAYYAKLDIGTPPQPVFVQIDTGSFELWVNPLCASLSGGDAQFCNTVGQYEPKRSSTATSLEFDGFLEYGIGSANITYFTDNIALPGSSTTLKSVQFGVAFSSQKQFSGVMGIGYGKGTATGYNNFVDELSAQNATKVKAFTVALGGKDEEEGIVVFGGVDTSRFSGSLAPLPIIPAAQSPDGVPRYWVQMESLSLNPPSGRTRIYPGSKIPAFFDTGATQTLLPPDLADAIARDFGAGSANEQGFYKVDCAFEGMDGTLDFAFDGMTIRIPYREMMRIVEDSPPRCFLGISPNLNFTLLGDTFMRSVYATFDLENDVIWMAQAVNCGSTPAALTNMSAMSSLKGACGANRVANPISTMRVSPSEPTATRSVSAGPSQTLSVAASDPATTTPSPETTTSVAQPSAASMSLAVSQSFSFALVVSLTMLWSMV